MKTPRLHHADARLLLGALQAAVALPIIAIAANIRLAITATAAAATIPAIRLPRSTTTIAAGALLTANALLTIIAAAPIQPPARPSSRLPATAPRPLTSRPALSAAASSVSRAPACASGRDLRLNVVRRAPFPSLAPGSGGPPAPERSQEAWIPVQAERAQPQIQVIQLVARLAAAPDLRDRNGTQVRRLRLTVQRPHREDGEYRGADCIDVTVIGGRAETCARHLATGRKAAVEGGLLDPTNRSVGEHSVSGVT